MVSITPDEIGRALKKMAKRKAADHKGIVIEMLQQGGPLLKERIADLFTDILQADGMTPEYWKETRLKVLFKKGDV